LSKFLLWVSHACFLLLLKVRWTLDITQVSGTASVSALYVKLVKKLTFTICHVGGHDHRRGVSRVYSMWNVIYIRAFLEILCDSLFVPVNTTKATAEPYKGSYRSSFRRVKVKKRSGKTLRSNRPTYTTWWSFETSSRCPIG
jgi:hypothetical protein